MPTKFSRGKTLAALLAAVTVGQTGCHSGWKMPSSSSFFPWSKKPSESTLAGSNPSLSVPGQSSSSTSSFTSPSGPASKNTPSLVSSTNPSRPANPYGSAPSGMSTSSIPPTSATRGLVANANGYQTGPYSTGTAGPTGYTAPTGYGNTAPVGQYNPTNGLAGQYNPTNGLAMASPPNLGPAQNLGAAPGAPSVGFGPAPGPSGLPAPAPSGLPPALASNTNFPAPPSQSFGTVNSTPLPPSGGVPAMPAAMSATNMAALPQPAGQSSMPNAAPVGYNTSQPTMTPSYAGAAPYRPGSTGRSTGYDFSKPNSSGGTNIPQTATGLPSPQSNLYR